MPRCDDLEQVLNLARPGDVLLTSRPGWVSSLIRFLSESPVSHSILVLPDQQVIMAHLPRDNDETVIQRYTYDQLQQESWLGMYCQRHQDVSGDASALARIVEIAELFENNAGPEGSLTYKFGTVDMVMGAALCLVKPASRVVRWLGKHANPEIERRLRSLFDNRGGPSELFCSEFVYRCFLDASQYVPSAAIDTSMLILRDWAAIITGQLPMMQAAEEFDVEDEDLTASWLQRPAPQLAFDPQAAGQNRVRGLLLEMRDFILSLQILPAFAPGVADFVTPVDLLRSPTFCTVAWWDG
jgi:hypothetical protein